MNGNTAGQGGVFREEKAAENALAISDLDRRGTMREAADRQKPSLEIQGPAGDQRVVSRIADLECRRLVSRKPTIRVVVKSFSQERNSLRSRASMDQSKNCRSVGENQNSEIPGSGSATAPQ